MLDIEGLERATLAAMPPEALDEIDGWLVALDHGTVGRAHSAAPLAHTPPVAGSVAAVEARYAGFDPVDGASRLAILNRARDSVFASIEREGATVAVGSACFSHGWCGVHGMRTLQSARRQGAAGSILAAFVREARRRGLDRAFLQVEEGNAVARSLYARLGFASAWRYRYWAR